MKIALLLLSLSPCVPAPPGKSTISASDAMHSLAFTLKYLPVTIAEDNGVGDQERGMTQGRVQVLQSGHYNDRNCQLYSELGSLVTGSTYQSMTANGLGEACTYSSGKMYTGGTEMHKVFAFNQGQCCNACVGTEGCVAATFSVSDNDQSGGQGPQSWEGFGVHITDVTTAQTTGGITVSELEGIFKQRFADGSAFDQFMDYSVTFYTYDLSHYYDIFKADGVPFHVSQWADSMGTAWYSLFFLVKSSHYIVELTSTNKPTNLEPEAFPRLEQRMSEAHTAKFKSYEDHPAKLLWISSINRAAANMTLVEDVYTNLLMGHSTLEVDEKDVTRRCFSFMSSDNVDRPGPTALDEDVCFTSRTTDSEKDAIFSVQDFEQMLWAEHAGTIGDDASSEIDKYTDNHYALPLPSAGLSELATYWTANDPYPITKDTRLAYACKQSYIIDPTGWSIQPIGRASWPKCGYDDVMV